MVSTPTTLTPTMPERAAALLRDPDQSLMPGAIALAVAAWLDVADPDDAIAEHAATVVVDAHDESTFTRRE